MAPTVVALMSYVRVPRVHNEICSCEDEYRCEVDDCDNIADWQYIDAERDYTYIFDHYLCNAHYTAL